MKQSQYNSYDDLPLFLNADIVAKVLGVSSSTSYELMHEPDFPVLNVGSRMVVPKEAFIHCAHLSERRESVSVLAAQQNLGAETSAPRLQYPRLSLLSQQPP